MATLQVNQQTIRLERWDGRQYVEITDPADYEPGMSVIPLFLRQGNEWYTCPDCNVGQTIIDWCAQFEVDGAAGLV